MIKGEWSDRHAPRNNPPPGWGQDELSAFFEAARSNVIAGYTLLPDAYQLMVEGDRLLQDLFEDYRDPEHNIAATLASRCHSALLVSAQLALSGQLPEMHMVLRGSLEFALYAHHISTSSKLADIWLHRNDNDGTRRECSKHFSPRSMFPILRERSKLVGERAGFLYDFTIDRGAHPNIKGVLMGLTHTELEGGDTQTMMPALVGDDKLIRNGILAWRTVAISCLEIIGLALPLRYAQIQFPARIDALRKAVLVFAG